MARRTDLSAVSFNCNANSRGKVRIGLRGVPKIALRTAASATVAAAAMVLISCHTEPRAPRSDLRVHKVVEKGNEQFKKNSYVSALDFYEVASRIHPKSPQIAHDRGVALNGARRYQAAVSAFEFAIAQTQDSPLTVTTCRSGLSARRANGSGRAVNRRHETRESLGLVSAGVAAERRDRRCLRNNIAIVKFRKTADRARSRLRGTYELCLRLFLGLCCTA